jgi:HAD superfamily hydrolase (TIGR01549 family)
MVEISGRGDVLEQSIKAVLWDLDGTLWNHHGAVDSALHAFCERAGIDFERFRTAYLSYSERLWAQYEEGQITIDDIRRTRFGLALADVGRTDLDAMAETERYLREYSSQDLLLPGARAALDWVFPRVPMGMVTNGFPDMQRAKLRSCRLDRYFSAVIISDEIGFGKPHPGIFQAAIEAMGVPAGDMVYIGDNWQADIEGAAASGLGAAIWIGLEDRPREISGMPVRVVRNVSGVRGILEEWLAADGGCTG